MSQAEQVGDQAYAAAEAEAEERDWGTSQEDVQAYAQAAAAAGGAAACAAVSAGAAAPLCAYLASEIAGWVVDVCYDWFTDNEEAEAARQRRIDVKAHFASMAVSSELDRENQRVWNQYLDNLITLHSELWPGARWEGLDPNHPQARWQKAMLLLQLNGAPVTERFGEHTLLGLESVRTLWAELDRQGVATAHKTQWVTERAIQIYDQLLRAYTAAVLQLTTAKAGEQALGAAEAQQRTAARVGAKYARDEAPAPRTVFGSSEYRQRAAMTRARPGHNYIPPSEQSWLKAATAIGCTLAVGGALVWDARRGKSYLRRAA